MLTLYTVPVIYLYFDKLAQRMTPLVITSSYLKETAGAD
jgi:hypothetical protein